MRGTNDMGMRTRLAAVVGGTALAMAGFSGPASADVGIMGSVYVGNNYASSNGTWVEVCDMEADGNGVYGVFYVNGSSRPTTLGDGNGSSGGCGNATFGSVQKFQVCEDDWGADTCSSWAKP